MGTSGLFKMSSGGWILKRVTIRGLGYNFHILHRKDSYPWLIMLHGFLGSGEQFLPVADRLSGHINICLPDLPAFGGSEVPSDPRRYSSEEQVADWIDILGTFPEDSRFVIHGYSMGGRLAYRIALGILQGQNPDLKNRFTGLIVESSTPGIRDENDRTKRMILDRERADFLRSDFPGFLQTWSALPVFANSTTTDLIYRIQSSASAEGAAASLREFGSGVLQPVWEKLPEITIPVLLIAGGQDVPYRLIASEASGMLPDSKLRIIQRAGHRVHVDCADEYIEEVNRFLDQIT
jgi:2-succinyl-6-hydroxy-2,4-cyclohexadiene-1-carboxylate synthase